MGQTTRNILKSYFELGDKPTPAEFAAFIDSCFNLLEDELPINKITNLQQILDDLTNGGSGDGDMKKADYDPQAIVEQLIGLTANQAMTNKTVNGVVLKNTGTGESYLNDKGEYSDVTRLPDYLKGVANIGSNNSSLWLVTPKSQYYNGNTYFVYIDFDDNKRKIAQYNHANDEWKVTAWTQTLFALGSNYTNKDYAHASPSVLVDSNGIIHITYSSAKNAGIYYIRSTNPEDILSFNSEVTIATGTDVSASYTSMIEHNNKTVIIYRGEDNGKSAIRRKVSLDAGATWDDDVLLIENAGSDPNGRVYYQSKISKNGRLHLSFHDSSSPYGNHDLFHAYSDNISDTIPSFYTIEHPSTVETLPLSLTGNAKIYDSVSAGWSTCYMLGTAIDDNGNIHIVTYVKKASETGELLHFYHDGNSWVNNLVVKADLSSWTVGSIQGDFINHNGVLLLMTEYISDPAYGTYGKSEIKEFISFDNGLTWKESSLITSKTPTTTANPFYVRGTRDIGWFENSNDYGDGKRVLFATRQR